MILVYGLLSGFVIAYIIKRIVDLYLLQIYSIMCIATLLSIILNMFGFDSTAPIYCQVSVQFYTVVKLNYVPKVWITFIAVSTSFQLPQPQNLIYFHCFFLALL
jgi:hypothetical protein